MIYFLIYLAGFVIAAILEYVLIIRTEINNGTDIYVSDLFLHFVLSVLSWFTVFIIVVVIIFDKLSKWANDKVVFKGKKESDTTSDDAYLQRR